MNRIMIYMPTTGTWCVKQFGTGDWDAAKGAISFQHGAVISGNNLSSIPLIADLYGDGVRSIVVDPTHNQWSVKGLITATNTTTGVTDEFTFPTTNTGNGITNGSHGVPLVGNVFGDGTRAISWCPLGTWTAWADEGKRIGSYIVSGCHSCM